MRLLLDANLSWRLCAILEPVFGEVDHVDQLDLVPPATDLEIWSWAELHGATIVTNDEDFYHFSVQKGFPPKVLLLRSGNQATAWVAELLERNHQQIKEFLQNDDYGLLELL